MFGGRTKSTPSTTFTSTPGWGRPTAPSFSGWLRASAAVHPMTSPISACPYPFSTCTGNLAAKRRAWRGDRGAVMLRTYCRGDRSVTAGSSVSIVSAAGGAIAVNINNLTAPVSKRSMITRAAPARSPNSAL